MSYSIDFVNNKLYGADDINAIRASIMTGGVIKKNASDCLVTLSNNTLSIAKGEALFGDGCRIELTEAENLEYSGDDGYVYFDRNYYDIPKADFGASLPENCIPLAKIIEGEVTDLRYFATLKVPSMATNRYLTKEFELDFRGLEESNITVTLTFEDRTDINYLTFIHETKNNISKVLIDFVHGYAYGICGDGRINAFGNRLNLAHFGLIAYYSKTGNKVTFDISSEDRAYFGTAKVTAL